MIIKVDKFQEVCKKILGAVDSSGITLVSDTLELYLENSRLYLNVTNKEYFVTVVTDIEEIVETDNNFHAVVNASLFLNLVSKLTTEKLSLTIEDDVLLISANGKYKIPMIFEGSQLIVLPKIELEEITSSFSISTNILQSILKYNTKEIQKSGIKRPVQKMFYLDEKGCITFAGGACVNSFNLERPVKILLTEKVVKLFKLFLSDAVEVVLGVNVLNDGAIQQIVCFKDAEVSLTAVLPLDDSLIGSVPVVGIRDLAETVFPYSAVLDTRMVLDALNRLALFDKNAVVNFFSHLTFSKNGLRIYDSRRINYEDIPVISSTLDDEYSLILDTNDLRITLETNNDQYFTINFGNSRAVVFEKPSIRNILPECVINF